MTDILFKGGRNHKAPYKTTHLRVPVEIISPLQQMINLYKRLYYPGAESLRKKYVNQLINFIPNSLDAAGVGVLNPLLVPAKDYQEILTQLKAADSLISELRSLCQSQQNDAERVEDILEEACKLRANAGGAIKKKVREAIEILE